MINRLRVQLLATLLQGGLLLSAQGQTELRLDDLFGSPTEESPVAMPLVPFSDLDMNSARESLLALEFKASAEDWPVVMATTEVLLAWLPPKTPEYGEALWYRALAFEAQGDLTAVDRIAEVYLREFSQGPRLAWFIIRVARGWTAQQRTVEAGTAWASLIDLKLGLKPEEALEGATALLRAFRPALAREALKFAGELLEGRDGQRILLDSLLMLDDQTVALPTGSWPEVRVRRAIMQELRGEKAEATRLLNELVGQPNLGTAELRAVEARAASKWTPWPPKSE
jgi:hypothetical protein